MDHHMHNECGGAARRMTMRQQRRTYCRALRVLRTSVARSTFGFLCAAARGRARLRLAHALARCRAASVELVEVLLGDLLEQLLGERAKQRPRDVERVENVALLVRP